MTLIIVTLPSYFKAAHRKALKRDILSAQSHGNFFNRENSVIVSKQVSMGGVFLGTTFFETLIFLCRQHACIQQRKLQIFKALKP